MSFSDENTIWSEPNQRLHIPLPENAGYATIIAIGYYVIAQIQKQHPPYFKENIALYTEKASKVFGGEIKVIVE